MNRLSLPNFVSALMDRLETVVMQLRVGTPALIMADQTSHKEQADDGMKQEIGAHALITAQGGHSHSAGSGDADEACQNGQGAFPPDQFQHSCQQNTDGSSKTTQAAPDRGGELAGEFILYGKMSQEPQQRHNGQSGEDQHQNPSRMSGHQQALFVQAGTVEPKPQQRAKTAAQQGKQGELVVF